MPTSAADVFVNVEDLEPRMRGIEIGKVHRVAVAEAGGPQSLAVVVDAHRAVDDLVPPVAIDIADAEVVIALAGDRRDCPACHRRVSKTQRCVSFPSRQSHAASTVRV